ncbi:MAG: putative DNA-binding ribbon-helix-helix protein [Halioglobus sp.]|jgi:predicted DNA-binding ribbon-helix-helix protein
MCEIFLKGDLASFGKKSRSMRIDGHVTSVCVEVIFWDLLDRISSEQDMKLSQFVSELYREAVVKTGGEINLSSVLRVACVNYLNHEQAQLAKPEQVQRAVMSV